VKLRHALAALTFSVAFAACSTAPPDRPDNAAAISDIAQRRSGDEVVVQGRVVRFEGIEQGPGGAHEYFIVTIARGAQRVNVLVAHNVGIAPFVPVHRGDDVIVKGELAVDPSGPVLHWTHHDPRFRHQPGFIEFGGRAYE
jgi:hypothetical protein